MRRIRNFFGSLDLSVFKIAGAALAAITVALLSSYLTGYVSSLILAGMASVVTAIASEFYRAVLSVTSRNAVAAAKRTVSSSSLLSTGSTQDGDTEEIPVVGSEVSTDNGSSVLAESHVSDSEGIEIDKSTLLGKIVSVLPEWLTSTDPRKVKRILRHTSMFMATMFVTIGATCLIVSAIKGEPVYKTIVTTNNADVDALKERIANLEAEHQKNGGSSSPAETSSTEKSASSQPSTASSASKQSSHDSTSDSSDSEGQSGSDKDSSSSQNNQNSESKSNGSAGYKSNSGSGNKTQAGGSSQNKQNGQQNSQQGQPDSEQNKAGVSQEYSEQNQNTENGGGNKPESGQDVNSQNDKAAPDSEIPASENKQP
jgi:nucleolar, serine-rich protein with a role in preribosome assembly or transport